MSDAAGGPFCPHCGRYLATLQWVAEPPPSTVAPLPMPRPTRYVGPPHYAEPPRWGFPAAPWPAADGPAAPVPPERTARSLAAVAVPLLWALAAVALLAAGAETWRYVLLLASREGALSADAVAASDALVLAAGTGTVLLGLVAGGFVVAWTLPAAVAAATRSGSRPSRSRRELVLGWLVPGWNLVVPGRCSPRSSTARSTVRRRGVRGRRGWSAPGGCCGWSGVCSRPPCWPGRGAPVCRPGRTGSCCTRC